MFSDLYTCHTCLKISYIATCAFIGECNYAAGINKARHSASNFPIASEKYWGGNVVKH